MEKTVQSGWAAMMSDRILDVGMIVIAVLFALLFASIVLRRSRVGTIGCLAILCGVVGMNAAPATTASVGGAVVYLNLPFHIGFMFLTVLGILTVLYAIARGR